MREALGLDAGISQDSHTKNARIRKELGIGQERGNRDINEGVRQEQGVRTSTRGSDKNAGVVILVATARADIDERWMDNTPLEAHFRTVTFKVYLTRLIDILSSPRGRRR